MNQKNKTNIIPNGKPFVGKIKKMIISSSSGNSQNARFSYWRLEVDENGTWKKCIRSTDWASGIHKVFKELVYENYDDKVLIQAESIFKKQLYMSPPMLIDGSGYVVSLINYKEEVYSYDFEWPNFEEQDSDSYLFLLNVVKRKLPLLPQLENDELEEIKKELEIRLASFGSKERCYLQHIKERFTTAEGLKRFKDEVLQMESIPSCDNLDFLINKIEEETTLDYEKSKFPK